MAQNCTGFGACGGALLYRPLIGIFRHCTAMCRPGMWRVVTGMREFGLGHFDAVVDDFGTLVKVSA